MESGTVKTLALLVLGVGVALAAVIALTMAALFWRGGSDTESATAELSYDELARLREQMDAIATFERTNGLNMRGNDEDRTLSHEIWLENIDSSPFSEEGDSAVREQKMLGLHCAIVEGLPLFDDFAMFSAEGDAYVKVKVQERVDQILSQLDGNETRSELGRIVFGAEWSPAWPDRDFCLQSL